MRSASLLLVAALMLTACGRRAESGAIVVSAIGGPPHIMAPAKLDDDLPSRLLLAATAQGLVQLDASGQIEPGLAERWTVIDNGLSYIFRLRDAHWSDGKNVTSEEVVTILRRVLKAETDNPAAPYLTAIDAIRAMTPQVIEIDLSQPRPDLLQRLAQVELALFRMNPPGGAGPMRLVSRSAGQVTLRAIPEDEGDGDQHDAEPRAGTRVTLIGERAAKAIVRFADHHSDMVTGGTVADWPLVGGVDIPASSIHRDPAQGLFGLVVSNRDRFLGDAKGRGAIAAAIDRQDMVSAIAPNWAPAVTILPNALDSAAPPTTPSWAGVSLDQRRANARALVTAWKAKHGGVLTLSIALPDGPGATLLYGWIGSALVDIGVEPRRVAVNRPADLRLIDKVSPYDSARWYLATACAPCGVTATAAIDAARTAPAANRAAALAHADAALTADTAFIPLASPLRWSLVAPGLDLWQPNTRAWHPLNELRSPPK